MRLPGWDNNWSRLWIERASQIWQRFSKDLIPMVMVISTRLNLAALSPSWKLSSVVRICAHWLGWRIRTVMVRFHLKSFKRWFWEVSLINPRVAVMIKRKRLRVKSLTRPTITTWTWLWKRRLSKVMMVRFRGKVMQGRGLRLKMIDYIWGLLKIFN